MSFRRNPGFVATLRQNVAACEETHALASRGYAAGASINRCPNQHLTHGRVQYFGERLELSAFLREWYSAAVLKPRVYVETSIPSFYHELRTTPDVVVRRE